MLFPALLLSLAFGADGNEPATLGIFVDFERTPSPASVEAMRSELKSLLAPAGITPAWRQLNQNRGNEEFDRVVLVRFKGTCRAGSRSDHSMNSDHMFADEISLAHTKVVNGRVLPLAEVECDNVRKGIATAPLKERQVLFGSVLGRVLAHELYHVLLQTVDHQREGLTKAVLSWKELVGQKSIGSGFLAHTSRR